MKNNAAGRTRFYRLSIVMNCILFIAVSLFAYHDRAYIMDKLRINMRGGGMIILKTLNTGRQRLCLANTN